ncbi:SMR family transporter [Escherichia coli]
MLISESAWEEMTCLFAPSLAQTLAYIPTGIAYAIWSGVGIVLISLLSWGFFGQRLDLPAIIGMMLICAGVLVINLLSRSTPH